MAGQPTASDTLVHMLQPSCANDSSRGVMLSSTLPGFLQGRSLRHAYRMHVSMRFHSERKFNFSLRRRLLPRLLRKSDLGCSVKVALREIGACVWGAVLRLGTT